MTGINHVLTGAVVANAISSPSLGLAAAFASHFALDVLPHFGGKKIKATGLVNSTVLATDALLITGYIIFAIAYTPSSAAWLVLVGFVSLMADLMWLPNYLRDIWGRTRKSYRGLAAWHKKIQWCERPWGIIFELLWLAGITQIFFSQF